MAEQLSEKIHASTVQALLKPTGAILVVQTTDNRRLEIVLPTPALNDLRHQLDQLGNPSSTHR